MAYKNVDISELDKNFKVEIVTDIPVKFFDARQAPIKITGLGFKNSDPDKFYYRLPESITAEQTRDTLIPLCYHTSGVAAMFRTNSPLIGLRADPPTGTAMPHMPATGVSGFDLHERLPGGGERYISTYIVPVTGGLRYVQNEAREWRDYIVRFPLYAGVNKLEIAISPESDIAAPTPLAFEKPIVFYGSSITQGGCCSRPSNSYSAMICRELDAELINLGFSGNAKGDLVVAEAIATLDMALFVYDYDENAPDAEFLKKTHEPFFKAIRKAQPNLPILIVSGGNVTEPDDRFWVIKQTYDNAIANGDKNVYLVPGYTLYGEPGRNFCTVDGCHPNDLGFYMMYKNLMPYVRKALGL